MSKTNLKPCPFCGSAAYIDFEPTTCTFSVVCFNELCPVEPNVISDEEDTVIKAWNTRHAE